MSGILTACCCGATGDLRPCCFGTPPHCEMKTPAECFALGGLVYSNLNSCDHADVINTCHNNVPPVAQCVCGAGGTRLEGVLVQASFTVCPNWSCSVLPQPCGGTRSFSFGGCGAAFCNYIGQFNDGFGIYCLYCSNFGGTCQTNYSCGATGGPGIGAACASCRRTAPPPPLVFFQCGYEVQRTGTTLSVAGRATITETSPIQCTAGGCGTYTSQRASFINGVSLTGVDYANFCAGQTITKITAASNCTPPPVAPFICGQGNPGNSSAAVSGAVTWNITRIF